MDFNILMQDGITLENVKNSDAIKFISELGLEGEALEKARSSYFEKSLLAFAKNKDNFVLGEEVVLYLDDSDIIVRKQFEDKIAKLSLDLVNETATITISISGVEKTKVYEKDTKVADVVKAFNAVLAKSLQK